MTPMKRILTDFRRKSLSLSKKIRENPLYLCYLWRIKSFTTQNLTRTDAKVHNSLYHAE